MAEEDLPKYKTRAGLGLFDDYAAPPEEGDRKGELMEDVNSMNPREFEIYLEKVRGRRKKYLKDKMKGLRQQARDKLVLPEDKTLVTLGTKGYVANPDTSTFQVNLTKEELESPGSDVLHSSPHRIHGLSYSRLPPSSNQLNPLMHHPGRAIDKVSQLTEVTDRARNFRPGEGTNRPWVVGLGGVGTKSKTSMGRISDIPVIAKGIDFTREDEHRGEARWRVTTASLKDPPQVLGLDDLTEAQRAIRRGRQTSGTKKISPLDTFRFDITVEHVSSDLQPESEREPEEEIGSRAWVGREPRTPKVLSSWSDDLGLGGPKSERKAGDGPRQLRSWEQKVEREARDDSAATVERLLARLNGKA